MSSNQQQVQNGEPVKSAGVLAANRPHHHLFLPRSSSRVCGPLFASRLEADVPERRAIELTTGEWLTQSPRVNSKSTNGVIMTIKAGSKVEILGENTTGYVDHCELEGVTLKCPEDPVPEPPPLWKACVRVDGAIQCYGLHVLKEIP